MQEVLKTFVTVTACNCQGFTAKRPRTLPQPHNKLLKRLHNFSLRLQAVRQRFKQSSNCICLNEAQQQAAALVEVEHANIGAAQQQS